MRALISPEDQKMFLPQRVVLFTAKFVAHHVGEIDEIRNF
jgi:hypothetical protein